MAGPRDRGDGLARRSRWPRRAAPWASRRRRTVRVNARLFASDACSAYQQPSGLAASVCSGGQCTSNSTIDFTLIAWIPESATWDEDTENTRGPGPGGVTLAIPHFPQYAQTVQNKCSAEPLSCAFLPDTALETGSLTVDITTQLCAQRPIDKGGAVLPANVQFWPLWSVATTTSPATNVAASSIGLPLLPVAARTAYSPGPGSGPGGAPPTQWTGTVGPGLYEEDIVPLDTNYPPTRRTGSFSGGFQTLTLPADTNECAPSSQFNTTFNVTQGTTSLEGFTVYVRDGATGRRISSLATLADAAGGAVTLLTSGELTASGEWPSGSQLVVAPPPGGARTDVRRHDHRASSRSWRTWSSSRSPRPSPSSASWKGPE